MFLPSMLQVRQAAAEQPVTNPLTNYIQHFSLKSTMMEQSKYSFTIQLETILIIRHKIISTSQAMSADTLKIRLNVLWVNLKYL